MKKIIILRGIPGSGKSSYVNTFIAEQYPQHPVGHINVYVFSADNYFKDVEGIYRFDAKKLGKAHADCLKKFTDNLIKPHLTREVYQDYLIVDNTNTTVKEMNPYAALAFAYNVPFEVVTIDTPPEIAAHRNTHGVPVDKVFQMSRRLSEARIPKDWPHRFVLGSI